MYINGNDLLVSIDGKAVGHCTTHTATFSTETKDTAVKPVATKSKEEAGKFKSKTVSGLSIQVKADGLAFRSETEGGFKQLLAKWKMGSSVKLDLFERENDSVPYLSGSFVITTLEITAPAGEDSTYSATFDNDGAPDTFDAEKFDINAS